MTTTNIVSSLVGVITALLLIAVYMVAYYYQIKNKIMEELNGAINHAETDGEVGPDKKAAVIEQLKSLVPAIFKPILTAERLGVIVQAAFDHIEAYAKKQVNKKIKRGGGDNE